MLPWCDAIKCFQYSNQVLGPYPHRSARQPWGRILGSRSIVAFHPLRCSVAHMGCFLKIILYSQIQYIWIILYYKFHTRAFRVKQRGALWLWVGDKNTIYNIAVCSLPFSRLIPDLVILYFLLLAHSVVDLHPGVIETKQDKQNVALHRLWYGEPVRMGGWCWKQTNLWYHLTTCVLTFAAQF